MLVVVSYDIEDDKTRTRLAHKLKDFGPRVQLSVFEADVTSKELPELYKLLKQVELGEDDSIRVYHFCEACFKKVKIWGSGVVTKDKDYYFA